MLGALLLTCCCITLPGSPADDGRPEPETVDCGTIALWTLLHCEGSGASLERIVGELPAARPSVHTLKELREAAARCGFVLEARELPGEVRPRRAAIALLRGGGAGHFVVVRPVGHTGKLVQVIDSARPSYVQDFAELEHSPRWTGVILVRRPSRPGLVLGWGLAISGAAMIGLLLTIRFRLRPRHVGPSSCLPEHEG